MTPGTADLESRARVRSISDDRQLVDRCVKGEPEAWESLYEQCHRQLLAAIRSLAGKKGSDPEFVDEIAARVWFFVVRNDGHVLARFDPTRNCRLTTFLAGIARNELRMHRRSEFRRRLRELAASGGVTNTATPVIGISDLELAELMETLTARELEFLVWSTIPSSSELTDDKFATSSAQWGYRLRRKIRAYLNNA